VPGPLSLGRLTRLRQLALSSGSPLVDGYADVPAFASLPRFDSLTVDNAEGIEFAAMTRAAQAMLLSPGRS
jgi:hypothetical protein